MTELLHFDEMLFHLVNSGCRNGFFDWLMPLLRDKYFWAPFYVFVGSFLLINFKKKGLVLILALVLAVGLSDNLNSQFLKKNVQRLRPCQVLEPSKDMHLLVPCGTGFSFPSTHAANHFAMAVFLSLALGPVFRWARIPLLAWAATVAFAQVYVGVHFPLDVTFGGLFGALVGWGVYRALRFLPPKTWQLGT
jgi:undecaprenyl-diphosphatase